MTDKPRRRPPEDVGRGRKDGKRFFFVMVPLDLNGEHHPDYHPRYGSLYIAIASICDFRSRRGWAKRDTLKKRAGITRNDHFYDARNWLQRHGYIDVIEGGGRSATSYILLERSAITFELWEGKPDPDWDRIEFDGTEPRRRRRQQEGERRQEEGEAEVEGDSEVEVEAYPEPAVEGSGGGSRSPLPHPAGDVTGEFGDGVAGELGAGKLGDDAVWEELLPEAVAAGDRVRQPGTRWDSQPDTRSDRQPETTQTGQGGTRRDSLAGATSDTYQEPSPTALNQEPIIHTDDPELSDPGEEVVGEVGEVPVEAEPPGGEWEDLPERAQMTLRVAAERWGGEVAREAAERYRQAQREKQASGGRISNPGSYMLAVVESVVADHNQRRRRVLARLKEAAEAPSRTGQTPTPTWWETEATNADRKALAWVYANQHLGRAERLAGVKAILEGRTPPEG